MGNNDQSICRYEKIQVHDRKDQLIFALTSLLSTLWVGLISVGFWSYLSSYFFYYWVLVLLNTIFTSIMFLCCIGGYYYAVNLENSKFDGLSKEKREGYERVANVWKKIWNKYLWFFYFGLGTGLIAFTVRFIGHLKGL